MLLDNKKIVITGASSGIGFAAAKLFAAEGAHVCVSARREDRLRMLADEIESTGGQAVIVAADLSSAAGVRTMLDKAIEKLGGLDGAFNNAGTIGNFIPMIDQSEEDWDQTMSLNLKSVWLANHYQATYFINTKIKGAIVNTSSWLAKGALPGSTVYSASKAGIDGFVRAAAIEWAEHGIRVNTINPGGIDTEMTREAFDHDQAVLDAFGKKHPIGRMGTPHETAELAAWLLSDRASFVTGQSILVDGGYTVPGQR